MKNKLTFQLLFFMCIFLGFTSLKAQNPNNIFYEDFESATFPPNGWTAIQDTQKLSYLHWHLFVDDKAALEGGKSAYVDTKIYNTDEDHQEPSKKEWLITPEISLPSDQSAQLSFLWQASSIQALEKKTYSTWLLITTNDGASWDTLWCMTDPLTVVNSGIPFPWANWSRNNSEIDLTKYKGKKVKLAWFYHNFYFAQGDMFKLDRIKIIKYNPILKPIASLNPTSFAFSNAYIGVPISSGNAFKLSNIGIDTLRITGIEGLEGSDYKCIIPDFSEIELKKNDVLNFSIHYTPTLEGDKNAILTIKTNGGDVKLSLSGTKISLPKDYSLESFEGSTFAPVGWTASSWNRSQVASSGYWGASSTFSNKCLLTSPRLDLSGLSSPYFSFDFIDYASDELYGSACDNINTVEFSSDGGKTWKVLFTSKAEEEGFWTRKQISLSNENLSDNCFIRFQAKIDGELSYEVLFSQWYLDNIVLPPLYGSKLPPEASTRPFPANNAKDVYTANLKMSWSEVLHATSYQVKIGTSKNQLGNVLDTTLTTNLINISGLLNSTTYYWTVTPKNAAGSTANPSLWEFTTIENITIDKFPYFQGFEDSTYYPPLGWRTDLLTEKGNKWTRSDIFPYDGKYSAYSGAQEGQTYMSMPAIKLPADKEIQIAFIWGNEAPSGLIKTLSPPLYSDPKYYEADSGYFEVSTDQMKWKTLLTISETRRDSVFWRRAKVVLSEYAGKTVFVRWRYYSFNYAKSEGISLDNVIVEEYHKNGKAVFNLSEWNAGVVNNKQTVNSKNLLSIMNDGDATLVVKSVSFQHPNFSSNLQIGTTLAKTAIKPFTITFVANPVGDLMDTMAIEFENGLIAKFPVRGNALPVNTRCYTFDDEEPFSTSLTDFTMIDADGKATVEPVLIYFPKRGTPLAYIAMNVRLADWRNIYPVSGEQCLSAFSAADDASPVEDWLISKKITATKNSKVRFYAKSYGNPEDFTMHKMTVLVSETDANKASFKAVKTAENIIIPHRQDSKFTEFSVNLGQYEGKAIHIALRQNADAKGFVMFLDDVWFEEFQFVATDNQAPQFTTTPAAGSNLNEVFTYNFKAIDPDGDTVKFSTVGLPSWLTITYDGKGGGTITGTPTVAGNVFFKIIATDGTASTTQEVLFSVNSSSNQAPSFTTTPPTEAQLGVEFTYEFKASDPENDAMQFSVVDLPSWLTATYNRTDGGTISGIPTQVGNIAFKIKVTDGQLNTTQDVAFTIKDVNNEIEKEVNFRCYPNPASTFINIETSENDFEITINNLSGAKIYHGKNIKTISLNNYPNGLYFVKFTSKNTVKITRIVKQ